MRRGEGWRLEQTYKYYTISLFVVYGTIRRRTFGDPHYPEIAVAIDWSTQEMMEAYGRFFGRDGDVNMWTRSTCYRTWISNGLCLHVSRKKMGRH